MDSIYQQMTGELPSGTWSSPAWFNGRLYYGGVGDNLKAFAFTAKSLLLPCVAFREHLHVSGDDALHIGQRKLKRNRLGGGEPEYGSAPRLRRCQCRDELYNSNQAAGGRDQFGAGNKFIIPTIANGKVYVGTTNTASVFSAYWRVTLSPVINTRPKTPHRKLHCYRASKGLLTP